MAYLYRHIRLDKNEPFYIGIGSDKNYARSRVKKRNNLWHKIANKTNYEIEIILDDLSWKDACNKEKEFIKLYGKKCDNTGILTNLTDGGEGIFGFKFSDDSRKKLSISQRNKKPISEETRIKMRNATLSRDSGLTLRGKKQSQETRLKRSKSLTGVKKIKFTCPHCNLFGGGGAMKQWHFDNCKHKKNAN